MNMKKGEGRGMNIRLELISPLNNESFVAAGERKSVDGEDDEVTRLIFLEIREC